jgi:protein phosphatase
MEPEMNDFDHLSAAALSDIGHRREKNEDAIVSLTRQGVFCVADGMGGVQGGEIASRFTVDAVRDTFTASPDAPFALTAEASARLAGRAINAASQRIQAYAAQHGVAGAGSTVVVLVFDRSTPARAFVLHAGDSRAYRYRDTALSQLTADHSLAAAAGISQTAPLPPHLRDVITRAVGISPSVELERTAVAVRPNDLFLLCTDGLSKMVPDRQLEALLEQSDGLPLDARAQRLVDAALAAGGEDNVSVLLVRVADVLPSASPRPIPPETRELETSPLEKPMTRPFTLGTLRKHLGHDAHPLVQFVKYGIVGGMATATHIVIFFLCGWLLLPCLTQGDIAVRLLGLTVPVISKSARAWNAGFCSAIGFVVSNVFCYILNRRFVFKPGRHHWLLEFLLFFAVSGISAILGTVIQTFLITHQGAQTTLAFGANIVCALVINYAMRKFVIFKG